MNELTVPGITVIVPTLNEESAIARVIAAVAGSDTTTSIVETIVVDGGSADRTVERARAAGARTLVAPRRGRAAQMNAGARIATGSVLYFLHADSRPPMGFSGMIADAVSAGATSGCFRLAFDDPHWFLRASAWCTRFDIDLLRFGDQSLFVARDAFERCGGFDESMVVLEDQEIVRRLRRAGRFVLLRECVETSARKYRENGIIRLQAIFALICLGYHCGIPQHRLCELYHRTIRERRHGFQPSLSPSHDTSTTPGSES